MHDLDTRELFDLEASDKGLGTALLAEIEIDLCCSFCCTCTSS